MRNKTQHWCNFELLVYTFFAVLSVCLVFYLYYYSPVNFMLLVAEDHIAEYGTSVSFGVAGIILLTLAFLPGLNVRRVLWMLIGLVALVIAAEEISWGQRVFYIETPGVISEYNVQNEITLHNLEVFTSFYKHVVVAYLILIYLVFSLVVLTAMPRLEEKLTAIGLPLIQLRLVPVFLLAPYFFIFDPTIYSDEIGELFLGIAVLMWAVDLFLVSIASKRVNSFTSVFIMTAIFSLAAIISEGLAYRHSADNSSIQERRKTLNVMASGVYSHLEMYEQAELVYSYIYRYPQYLTDETRVNHARMLLATGKQLEAAAELSIAARNLEAKEPLKNSNSKQLRLLGVIYMLQMENRRAEHYFDKAVEIDQKVLALNSTADEKAEALWSISRTMQARGDVNSAITSIEQAIKHAASPALRRNLEQQLYELTDL